MRFFNIEDLHLDNFLRLQYLTEQYSHGTSGSLVKHHGPPGLPSGFRQKLFSSSSSRSLVEPSFLWSNVVNQSEHSRPEIVRLSEPLYSVPSSVSLHSGNSKQPDILGRNNYCLQKFECKLCPVAPAAIIYIIIICHIDT